MLEENIILPKTDEKAFWDFSGLLLMITFLTLRVKQEAS